MDQMRAQFVIFVQTETALRNMRSQAAQRGARTAIEIGLGLSLSLGFALALLARRQLVTISRNYGRALAVTRQQTEALRESDERFQLVARATKDTIWDWNLLTNEIWWNDNFPQMLCYSPD